MENYFENIFIQFDINWFFLKYKTPFVLIRAYLMRHIGSIFSRSFYIFYQILRFNLRDIQRGKF